MYPYSPTLAPETPDLSYLEEATVQNGNDGANETETHVQAILAELEQLSPEIQLAVYSRLLSGLAAKLTAAVVTKAIAAARVDQQTPAKPKATASRSGGAGKAGGRQSKTEAPPRANSLLRQLNDAADPIEAWERFGANAAQVFDVLREEPAGMLEAMRSHRNMPPGPKPRSKSREKIAQNIALRLEDHFKGN